MNNSSPLYRQIANKIKEEIINSRIGKDEAIPSEPKLAEKFNVSRVTIRQAIDILVKEDILYKVQGSGTYVKIDKIEHHIHRLLGFTEEMKMLNKNPETKILDFKMMDPDDSLRNCLQLKEDEKVFFIKRLRCADDVPMTLEETYLPVNLFPDLSLEAMSNSKYQYIESKGFKIKESFQEIIPMLPDQYLIKTLGLKKTIPIVAMNVWSTFTNGTVFEYTTVYFRSDKYKFKFISTRL